MEPFSIMSQRAREKAPDVFTGIIQTKIGVSLAIFFLSLLGVFWSCSSYHTGELTLAQAVSFPSLSKRIKFLRIPSVVFFLGKHFGTGVILSTAFVHLLPDAFNALQSRWTGLIVCVVPSSCM